MYHQTYAQWLRRQPQEVQDEVLGLTEAYRELSPAWLSFYAIHGVYVPQWIVEHPERITIDKIRAEPNIEIARIMRERYGTTPGRSESAVVGRVPRGFKADDMKGGSEIRMIKLTDADGYTRRGRDGESHWAVGETVAPIGTGDEPCGPGVLHLYASALEAVIYDPIQGKYLPKGRAIEVSADADHLGDDGLKMWTSKPVRVLRQVELPTISLAERVAWAICLAPHASTHDWAIAWLSGTDRSRASAVITWAAAGMVRAAEAAAWAVWAAELASAVASAEAELASAATEEAVAVWAAEAATARAAEAMAARAEEQPNAFRARSLAAFDRGRRILAGELPAEQYEVSEPMA